MPGTHAILSASGAALWSACPGSVHMREQFPEKGSSVAAQEGTIAHALGAYYIEHIDRNYDDKGKALYEDAVNFYEDHSDLEGSAKLMDDYMHDYADFVWKEYTKAREADDTAEVSTEQKVDFSKYVPGGFGTSDVIITYGDTIEIIDLKYGKGVPVNAVNNPQIRLYAIGSLDLFDGFYDFKQVKMVIYQPRLESVTDETMSVEDLLKWADDFIKPAAKKALAKKKEYHPGPWCTSKFCPGAAVCKKRAEYLLELNKYDDDPALLSRDEIGAALQKAEELSDWMKKLKDFTMHELESGNKVPGWKIVAGRSVRKYTDEDKVAAALEKAGYEKATLYKAPELLGITAMEKLIGKKDFKTLLTDNGLVEKPEGKPTLAPDSDSRPELVKIKPDDFDE